MEGKKETTHMGLGNGMNPAMVEAWLEISPETRGGLRSAGDAVGDRTQEGERWERLLPGCVGAHG